jgi:aspartyl/glutamyl-tRNA(Asn/Gln) amidotransferase C subunit
MIDERLLDSILALCKFTVSEDEKEEFRAQVGKIIEYFTLLRRYDTSQPSEGRLGGFDRQDWSAERLFADTARPGLSSQSLQGFAVHFLDGFFTVPRIIADDKKEA